MNTAKNSDAISNVSNRNKSTSGNLTTSISKINIEEKKATNNSVTPNSSMESKFDDFEEKIYLSGDQVSF